MKCQHDQIKSTLVRPSGPSGSSVTQRCEKRRTSQFFAFTCPEIFDAH